ncbi:hypothetical protein [Ascidiimonas sp. W6]|uniref:hypothetical protein n=1 Tax=Ascidiimonas meishanensis TaxID=3128903 RepID=UPI0030EBFF9B
METTKSSMAIFIEFFTLLLIVTTLIMVVFYYGKLPEKIPVYFNEASETSNIFGSKNLLWIVPMVSGIITILLSYLNQKTWLSSFLIKVDKLNAKNQYDIFLPLIRHLIFMVSIYGASITLNAVLEIVDHSSPTLKNAHIASIILLTGVLLFYLFKSIFNRKKSAVS